MRVCAFTFACGMYLCMCMCVSYAGGVGSAGRPCLFIDMSFIFKLRLLAAVFKRKLKFSIHGMILGV